MEAQLFSNNTINVKTIIVRNIVLKVLTSLMLVSF